MRCGTIKVWLLAAFAMLSLALCPALESPSEGGLSVRVRRARIVAAGDLMQHQPQIDAALCVNGRYDYSESFKYVEPYFRGADLSIINLETTLSYEGPYSGYPAFCSPAAVADAMRDMSIDVAALANNHCCDKGARGIKSTCSILDSYGINRVGVYSDSVDYKLNRVCYLKRNDIRFAVVNYTYGVNSPSIPHGCIVNQIDTLSIAQDLAIIDKAQVDCVIAFMHWGYEYQHKAHPNQRKVSDFLQRNGVDLVIGSHPHVVQPVERSDDGRVTLYSLGNFVSNQRKRYSDGGLIATIDVEIRDSLSDGCVVASDKKYNLKLTPVWVYTPGYVVLPEPVGDTLQMNSVSRQQYNLFIGDTKKILSL